MALAVGEEQRFHHEYISTEHILSGLLKEGAGVATMVLRNLDIDLGAVKGAGGDDHSARTGADPHDEPPSAKSARQESHRICH